MEFKPLKGITILDFSHRLPGPLSTLQLTHLGAKVFKIEDHNFGDPFDGGSFDEMDSSFSDWYRTLNEGKIIKKVDLAQIWQDPDMKDLLKKADIILMGLPPKVQQKNDLEEKDFKKLKDHGVFFQMTSSRELSFGMHDLNALAGANLLRLHSMNEAKDGSWIAPPFLPVAGVSFASHLATEMLAALYEAKTNGQWITRVSALEEAVENLLTPLYSKKLQDSSQTQFLHNGRYPCYAIYPLQDRGHLAVACVEQKYWQRFTESFQINMEAPMRFANDPKVFREIAIKLKEYRFEQAAKICQDLDACVSLVD